MVDKEPWRLELAEELGASAVIQADNLTPANLHRPCPARFEVVADATGVPGVLEQTFQYVRPGGKVWVFGVAGADARVPFAPYEVFRKDLKIIGSFALNKTFHEAIQLVQGGGVKLAPLISHALPLSDFAAGMEVAERDPKRMKIQFALDEA